MPKFYNPYHFVPVRQKKRSRTMAYTTIAEGGDTYVRHDRWSENSKSGVIQCALTLNSPTVVGNEHTTENPNSELKQETLVNQYRHPKENKLALPANSLRGMVSSLAETLSQSAIRVLNDEHYSVRQAMGGSISAVGLVEQDAEGQWQLRPLCLPTLSNQSDNSHWQRIFKNIPLRHCLQVYTDLVQQSEIKSYQAILHLSYTI